MTEKLPFIPMAIPTLGEEEQANVVEAVSTGWISSVGGFVSDFEEKFSKYCGVDFGVAVSSGTTALHLALEALGLEPNDEVIIPSITHVAVYNAVVQAGAVPVLADSESDTWNISPEDVARRVTAKTKAIIVVHLYGHPVNVDPILDLCKENNIYLIEDAAEAHGAKYNGRMVGSLGHLACFSFYANKLVTTGEGGMVVTSDPEIDARLRKLRDQAYEPKRFWHTESGFNYRLTNVQAAIGVGQLNQLDKFIGTHRTAGQLYTSLLSEVPRIKTAVEQSWAYHVYWMYPLEIVDATSDERDSIMSQLRDRKIDSRTFFYPLQDQPITQGKFLENDYPVSSRLGSTGLNLPLGNNITKQEVQRISTAIAEIVG